jgi:poly(hydroxyalkanoate) depolymerase family esterase
MPDGIHQLQVAGHRTDSTIDIDTMQVNIQNETGNITEAQDSSFGSNPGNLRMFKYIPDSVSSFSGPRPLVVALHGCAQTAASFAADTAWNAKAEEKGFYVVYPQQKAENHSDVCFSWFSSAHQKRGYREPLSIYQMVQYMKEHYNIDDSKVYITGFSAGGCMTSVMLATYPDVFSGGGIAAGIAYKMAEDVASAGWAMDGAIDKSASDLASFVTGAYPQFSGTYPKVILFQGTNDQIVDKKNLTELMEQWTAVHSISSTPGNPCDSEETLYGTRVKTYCINGMQHKVPRDVAAETSYVYPYAAVDATLKMIEFFGL